MTDVGRISISLSMDQAAMAIMAGMLPLLFLPRLPTTGIWWLIALLLLFSALLAWKVIHWLVLAGVAFLWASAQAMALLQLVETYGDRTAVVSGVIRSIDIGQQTHRRLLLEVDQVARQLVSRFSIALTAWEPEQAVSDGQRWQLQVLLRPVHSRLNEGGFDRQRWSIAHRQVLTGRVVAATMLTETISLRQSYANRLSANIRQLPFQDLIWALAMGERELMSEPRRQLLQQTGTAHLMAISGLHISLVALFGWSLVRLLQLFLPLRHITPLLPLLCSLLAGWSYVWLSDANPPALRAGMALLFWSVMRLTGTNYSPWQLWLRGVAVLLILDPFCLLSDSFWLSCGAVAGLIFWFQWLPLPHTMQRGLKWLPLRWLHLQAGIFFLLAPMQILLFQGISTGALLAWAVPLVSLLSVPLILLALLFNAIPIVGAMLWSMADLGLQVIFYPLSYFARGWYALSQAFLLLTLSGWLLIPALRLQWWRTQPLSLLGLLIVLLWPRWRSSDVIWRATMLDVGHGLSMVIERAGHAIVYDTGNAWPGGSMAQLEILPYLRWRGLTVDYIIISHQHQDHIGGLPALLAAFPDSQVISSASSLAGELCLQGRRWQWQGLQLEVLWPKKLARQAMNQDSCTIRITDGQHSLLLTGDLELAQEQQLVAILRHKLVTDILQVPHHGSQTSSSSLFLRNVQPRLAVNSTARYNPWRLPAKKVTERYRQQGIRWYSTAQEGQLTLLFYRQHWEVQSFRQHVQTRWYHSWFGLAAENR